MNELLAQNLLCIKEHKLSALLTNIFNVHLRARSESNVDTITLSQLDGVTTGTYLDRSTSGGASVVAGPLDKMGVNTSAPSGVGEGGGGR